jgi:hypothetical protein
MVAGSFLLFLAQLAVISAQGFDDPDCPFVYGSCPVTLDNVIDVFFYDVVDQASCQHQCKTISACKNFTMMGVADPPHTKCFLFKSCDELEECDDCISGPEEPPIMDCITGNYTCPTTLDNIVDVYYFDIADDISCHHQCQSIPECNFWTQYHVEDSNPHHKCFLFKTCNTHEPCKDCETGTDAKVLFYGAWRSGQ